MTQAGTRYSTNPRKLFITKIFAISLRKQREHIYGVHQAVP
jgi:hypothetical protein